MTTEEAVEIQSMRMAWPTTAGFADERRRLHGKDCEESLETGKDLQPPASKEMGTSVLRS